MKNKINLLSTLIIAFAITSCGNNQKPEDPKDVATEQNEEKFETKNDENDAKFLVNAAEINLAEIQLGQMAQTSGVSSHVKELGKMMETDHTKALGDLKGLAEKKGISIPATLTDKGLDEYNSLSKKTGKDFDKEYSDMMVKGREDAINKFEKASTDAKDADIRSWASTMLPTLRTHLEHSKNCQEMCKKNK